MAAQPPRAASQRRDRLALATIAVVSSVVILLVGILLIGGARGSARREASVLPAVNAVLNATSALLLATGYLFIRRRNVAAHRACMLVAFGASSLFLISYVTYHYRAGSVSFEGHGWIRPVYFVLLISHIVLAAAIVPLALTTIYRAWGGQFERHVRIARWTLPVWLYVSVTGVVVYWMLYRLGPPP
jgi:putative membrane protein